MFIVYQDAPLHHLFVNQISRQLDNLFPLYDDFHTFTKRRKNEETKPIFENSDLRNTWHNLVEIWMTVEGISTAKIIQLHEVTCARKLHYCSFCQYTHVCGAPASWAA